jgi:transcriptional regulator with XRE-family HTH domain
MAEKITEILARNIRKERAVLSISQDELADKSGLHRTYIGGIERGERNITLNSLEKIAHALGLNPKDLIDEKRK